MGCGRCVVDSTASLVYDSSTLRLLLLVLERVKKNEVKGEVVGKGLHGLVTHGSYEGDIGSNDGRWCIGENGGTQVVVLAGPRSREISVKVWMSPSGSSQSSDGVSGSQRVVVGYCILNQDTYASKKR